MSDKPATQAGRDHMRRFPYWLNSAHDTHEERLASVLAIEAEASASAGALLDQLRRLAEYATTADNETARTYWRECLTEKALALAAQPAAPSAFDPRQPHGVSEAFQHESGAPCVVCDRAQPAAPSEENR